MAVQVQTHQLTTTAKSAGSVRAGGVLQVTPASINSRGTGIASSAAKTPTPRLKVLIRRLPPGLTEAEFTDAIGPDWKLGGERVDWMSYREGKVTKNPANPSRPSRAYLHLTRQEYLVTLSEKVRETTFLDARGSAGDPALLGLPNVEFATFTRTPTNKPRKDPRQGTIDQDPEFINFLESLTNPIVKVAPDLSSDKENRDTEDRHVTPLIQYLRDKKANKGKESATQAKGSKHSRQDSKDTKAVQSVEKKIVAKGPKDAAGSGEKRATVAAKAEKAAREAVKVLNKQANAGSKATGVAASQNPLSAASKANSSHSLPPATVPAERKRERGSVSAAAKILQRDLGIAANAGTRRKRDNVAALNPSTSTKQVDSTPDSTGAVAQVPKSIDQGLKPSAPLDPSSAPSPATSTAQPPSAPAPARNQQKSHNSNASRTGSASSGVTKLSSPALPSSTATQAFLKHANASQGITETLLESAFQTFGTVTKVEIDKKKGFAYVDFAESEGLQRAIAASPVTVAQGSVVVLEKKTIGILQARSTRGGTSPAGGRGGSAPAGRGAPTTSARGGGGASTSPARGGGPPTGPKGGRGGGGRGRGGKGAGGSAGQRAAQSSSEATKEAAPSGTGAGGPEK